MFGCTAHGFCRPTAPRYLPVLIHCPRRDPSLPVVSSACPSTSSPLPVGTLALLRFLRPPFYILPPVACLTSLHHSPPLSSPPSSPSAKEPRAPLRPLHHHHHFHRPEGFFFASTAYSRVPENQDAFPSFDFAFPPQELAEAPLFPNSSRQRRLHRHFHLSEPRVNSSWPEHPYTSFVLPRPSKGPIPRLDASAT